MEHTEQIAKEERPQQRIGRTLIELGNQLQEYSDQPAKGSDALLPLVAGSMLAIGVAAALNGNADQLMSSAINMNLHSRIIHPGLELQLEEESQSLSNGAELLKKIAFFESAAAALSIPVSALISKINPEHSKLKVSTHAYPLAARALIYVGNQLSGK